MSMKRKILAIFLSIIAICLVICLCILINNRKNNDVVIKKSKDILSAMTDKEKEILNLEKTEEEKEKEELQKKIEEKTTTDEYKKYDELTNEQKKKIDVIPRKKEVPTDEINEIDKEIDKDNNIVIPSKFDLRDQISIKVENQESFGLCWAFASFNALETHLALKQKQNYDFSEIHLDYIESNLLYGSREIHNGGNWDIFANYFNVSGPIKEEETTYDDQPEEVYKKYVDTDSDIIITKDVKFPAISKGENKTNEEDTKKIRDSIKKHIMINGGVYAKINLEMINTAHQFRVENSNNTNLNYHAITLIGWDDNYSKDKFDDINQDGKHVSPEHDGAYIALNSWGETFGENGYFYISYDDELVETDVNGILSTSIEDAHKVSDIKSDVIRNYIINNYKNNFISYNGEDYITDLVLRNTTYLDLSNMNLTNNDLADIALFPTITGLFLSNNLITDISNLPNMPRLSSIDLSNNKISDFTILNKYSELYHINLSNNNIDNIDFLSNMKKLTYIELQNNNISNISSLTTLPEIDNVNLDNNNIKDVSSLNNKKILKLTLNGNSGINGYEKLDVSYLSLNNCNIEELNDMSNNDQLSTFEISNNKNIIINNNYLPKKIYTLNISDNNLDNIDFLKNVENLVDLNISNNNIINLDGLPGKKNNGESGKYLNINISNNPMKNIIKLNEYQNTTIIYKNSNNVDLNIFKGIKNIISLNLSNSNITDISSLNIDSLKTLDLSKNVDITNLDKLAQTNIDSLILDECNITDLNEVSKINKLKYLSLDSNNIKDISLLNSLSLTTLSLANNYDLKGKLTTDSLESVNLENTNMTNLDIVKDLKKLTYLNVNKNNVNDILKIYDYFPIKDDNKFMYIQVSDENTEYSINADYLDKIGKNDNITLSGIDYIDIKLEGRDFKEYINNNWNVKRIFMQLISSSDIKISNGTIDKKISSIKYEDDQKPFVISDIYSWKMGVKVYK